MKIICDWKNCKEIGAYKAPIEKDNSKTYRLLCLNHIKEFNKNWNYFENMNDQEIEFFIKSDLTWHKSTKSFGSSENFFNLLWNNALEDKLNIFKSISNDFFPSGPSIFKMFPAIATLTFSGIDIFIFPILDIKIPYK